jgi:hypothetical protein
LANDSMTRDTFVSSVCSVDISFFPFLTTVRWGSCYFRWPYDPPGCCSPLGSCQDVPTISRAGLILTVLQEPTQNLRLSESRRLSHERLSQK